MRSILHERLRVLPLNEKYDLSMFFSTNNELNDFLKNDALNSQDVLISRTYLCYHDLSGKNGNSFHALIDFFLNR